MLGALKHGDFAVTKQLSYNARLAVGDVVEIDHPDFGLIVKRITEINDNAIRVAGDTLTSIDTEQIGDISRSQIVARLIWRISPNGLSQM